jgi:hypothetical protein
MKEAISDAARDLVCNRWVNNRGCQIGEDTMKSRQGISDHKRTLAINADKRASVKANAIREEGRGEVTKCVDEKVWDGGKGSLLARLRCASS